MSEIFLDAAKGLNDENININGHSILRVDHPFNNTCGGICIYFKQPLPIIRRDDISTTQEILVTGISVKIKHAFLQDSIGHQVKIMTNSIISVQN